MKELESYWSIIATAVLGLLSVMITTTTSHSLGRLINSKKRCKRARRRIPLRTILALLQLTVNGVQCQTPDPNVLLQSGDAALGQGAIDQAIDYYVKGIELVEQDGSLETEISLWTNLATAYSSQGDADQAISSYERAIQAYDRSIEEIVDRNIQKSSAQIAAQSAFFLGMEYQDQRQIQDAVDAYQYAFSLDAQLWAAMANLGSVLQDELKDYRRALEAYNAAYAILTNTQEGMEPTDPPDNTPSVLSQLQYRMGLCITHDPTRSCVLQDDLDSPVDCQEMASHAFALAVQLDPSNENAKHMLATTTADATMKRASNEYVKSLFDDYATNFEHSLVDELHYTGFERLRRGFDRAFSDAPPMFEKVVDAGCGTGLVGEQFRNVSQHLLGVDLSEAILVEAEKARPKLYDELRAGDVIDIFRERKPIDLIVAADSYIYFGDLNPLFQAMNEALADKGYLAFTLENVSEESEQTLSESKPDWKWQLTASGRFAHCKEYVITTAQNYGFTLVRYERLDGFRYEQGVEVRGHLFIMTKLGTDQEHSEL